MSKYTAITGFFFCIHIAIALINAFGVFSYAPAANEGWIASAYDYFNSDPSYSETELEDPGAIADLLLTVKAVAMVAVSWAFGIIAVPYTLRTIFLVPFPLYYYLSAPIYLMYMVALIQIFLRVNIND